MPISFHPDRKISVALFTLSSLAPGLAMAQASDQGDVNEIIVTANKRSQSLNDVGLAISVLSGKDLQRQNISSLSDIARSVPSLNYTQTNNSTPVYTLRGVGFYEASLGSYPAVSVYVDQVPLPFAALTLHSALDLERIEVLKGPQGTLFGQNSTGGAINYIAAQPTSTLAGRMKLSYGRFNDVVGEGFISGPLTDTLTARLSVRAERADPWQISNSRAGLDDRDARNGKTRSVAARLLLNYDPSGAVALKFNINGWVDHSDPQAPQFIARKPSGILSPEIIAAQLSPHKSRAADWRENGFFGRKHLFQASARADISVSDTVTLTSISAYTTYKRRDGFGITGLPLELSEAAPLVGRINSFSQELRLANDDASSVRWIAGVNYERSKVEEGANILYGKSGASYALGRIGYPLSTVSYQVDQKYRNAAVFGNVEFDLSPQLTLKGGARYTNARDRGSNCVFINVDSPTEAGAFVYNLLLGGRFGQYVAGTCFPINDRGIEVNGVAPGAPGQYAQTLKEDNLSWRAGIDWKVSRNALLYANVARGYKAGSFPAAQGTTFTALLPVTQESLLSFEGGAKTSLLNGLGQISLAGFYYDYTDKQIQAKTSAPPFGILNVLQNIPKSSIRGVEMEASLRPAKGLSLSGSLSYLDGKIDRFIGINGSGVAGDFSGSRIPFTPRFQFGLSTDYEAELSADVTAYAGFTVTHQSASYSIIGGEINPPNASPNNFLLSRIKPYSLVDLRSGVRFAESGLGLSAYVKNLFNQYYWVNVHNATDVAARFTGKPITYGLSLSYDF